jgi:hypothetical protein
MRRVARRVGKGAIFAPCPPGKALVRTHTPRACFFRGKAYGVLDLGGSRYANRLAVFIEDHKRMHIHQSPKNGPWWARFALPTLRCYTPT